MHKLTDFNFKPFLIKNLKSGLPIILFLFSLAYFSYVVGFIKWPTPSDALNHGKFVANAVYENKITGIGYPYSFHVTAANLSLSMHLIPGEAIFTLTAAIMALIPSVLYSLSYINTRSKIFSLLAFMSAFLINSSYELGQWLVSNFLIGRYANIYGYLGVFMFWVFISLEENSGRTLTMKTMLPVLLISIFLFITYPLFVLFVVIYLIFFFC